MDSDAYQNTQAHDRVLSSGPMPPPPPLLLEKAGQSTQPSISKAPFSQGPLGQATMSSVQVVAHDLGHV